MSTSLSTTTTTPGGHEVAVTLTSTAAESLVELLELCEQFLRTAGPAVQAELQAFLGEQRHRPDPVLLIDLLGFNGLFLQAKIASATLASQQGGQR